jgi:hypothetical protein
MNQVTTPATTRIAPATTTRMERIRSGPVEIVAAGEDGDPTDDDSKAVVVVVGSSTGGGAGVDGSEGSVGS